jgi:hypothetical protein
MGWWLAAYVSFPLSPKLVVIKMIMNRFKILSTLLLLIVSLTQVFASIPLGVGRKTATGTVEMYGCLQANDYYIINFAAYPVAATKAKKPVVAECVNISATGDTIISLDMLDRDLRHKKIALKILDRNGQVLHETPFDVPKQGVASVQVNFANSGNYEVVLSVEDSDLNIDKNLSALHIPLTVAVPGAEPAARNTMTGFFILIGLLIVGLALAVPRLLKPETTA